MRRLLRALRAQLPRGLGRRSAPARPPWQWLHDGHVGVRALAPDERGPAPHLEDDAPRRWLDARARRALDAPEPITNHHDRRNHPWT
jgi:hypothetical protein